MGGRGHVFVVHGDLLQLHADDLLVPCDSVLNVTAGWQVLLGATEKGPQTWIRPVGATAPAGFAGIERGPLRRPDLADGRRVWLVNSGGRPTDIDWLIASVRNAIRTVSESGPEPRHRRERQLIAMPVFGVGSGGFDGQRGAVLDRLLAELDAAVAAPDAPDLALVLSNRADYAAVQSRRRSLSQPTTDIEPLRDLVRRSGLVLFIGAGASAGAGFPSWKALLAELAAQSPLSPETREAVLRLPAPDAADVIGSELDDLHTVIARRFVQDGCSLIHALLASLRIHEAVTTNYDTLYENAASVPHGGAFKVLPRERRSADEPWLLKLHGDINVEGSIVLTREQYLRFDTDSIPLAAVVQSAMVTKHMLFVGYSLSDENFIRLARQVRQLFRSAGTDGPVGTVLTLFDDPARDRLWQGDLEFIPMTKTTAPSANVPEDVARAQTAAAARQLEIFLDQLAVASCDDAPYVLKERYRELVSADDQRLAAALQPLAELVVAADGYPESSAWAKARGLLRELGWTPPPNG